MKRNPWRNTYHAIKDKSDNELLDIVINNEFVFSPLVCNVSIYILKTRGFII